MHNENRKHKNRDATEKASVLIFATGLWGILAGAMTSAGAAAGSEGGKEGGNGGREDGTTTQPGRWEKWALMDGRTTAKHEWERRKWDGVGTVGGEEGRAAHAMLLR